MSNIYSPVMRAFTDAGAPGVGYKLYTYEAGTGSGTSTEKSVYTDKECTVAATNPVVFDSRGEAEIYGIGFYYLVLKTDEDVTIWSVDQVRVGSGSEFDYLSDYSDSLTTAISEIGATETTLFINSTATVSANATVPATLRLIFHSGGIISHGSYNVTINSAIDAGPYQIFTGTGNVSLVNKQVFPEWFGDVTGSDCASIIDAAYYAMPSESEMLIRSKIQVGQVGWTGLEFDKDNTTIRGMTYGCGFRAMAVSSQIITGSSLHPVILLNGVDGFNLIDIDIDANDRECVGFGMQSCTNCTINGNYIHDTSTASTDHHGMFCVAGTNNSYLNNRVKDNGGRGMWIGNVNTGHVETAATIQGNHVIDNGYSGICGAHQYCSIVNNVSRGNGMSGYVAGSNASVISHSNTITGNICEGNGGQGIQMGDVSEGDYFSYGLTVSGNVCRNNDAHGIYASQIENCSVSGNTCYDNTYSGGGSNGAGIVLTQNVRGVSVIGNTCFDSRTGGSKTQNHGIYLVAYDDSGVPFVDPHWESIAISNNVCRGNATHGIFLTQVSGDTAKNISIVGNVATDNGDTGIQVVDAVAGEITDIVVFGNLTEDNTTNDLRIDDTITNSMYPFNKYTNIVQASSEEGYGYETATGTYTIDDIKPITLIDSTDGVVTATLANGSRYGQRKTIIMSNATNSSSVSVTTHETSNPEVITFSSLSDTAVLEWNGYEWMTIKLSGATV